MARAPPVVPHPAVQERLARLAPDQRAAATAPPGPVLCVAPAGSGKTTTLVARDRVARGRRRGDPRRSRRSRSTSGRRRSCRSGSTRRSRRSASRPTRSASARSTRWGSRSSATRWRRRRPLADRAEVLSELAVRADARDARPARHGVLAAQARPARRSAEAVAADPVAGPRRPGVGRRTSGRSRRAGGLDFDDLVRAGARPARSAPRRCSPDGGPRARTCSSTRPRTSTGPSSISRSCWPRRRTGSSSSATTTSRSTAGGWPTCGACWAWPARCPACGGSTS